MHQSSSQLIYCPMSLMVAGYVNCTLNDELADQMDTHLSECESCTEALTKLIDNGVAPDWLPRLRELQITANDCSDQTIVYRPTAKNADDSTAASEHTQIPENRYHFVRLHAEGGMGQVWEGWDTLMKRRVAMKQLRSAHLRDSLVRRLFNEASSLARLSHANIVSVFEILVISQKPVLVMEFINGPTLGQLRKDTLLSERQAASIVEKLADAISHAHKQGVVHRDLKPGNILLSSSNDQAINTQSLDHVIPKITDFGLAKILEGDDLTRTGELLGTPAYMAPEQTLGRADLVGPSADIYGLGAILYELLTGTPPHVGEDSLSTMLLVREREPISPRTIRLELSKDMETICLKCLQKLPKHRYESAADLRNDLLALLDGRPISARPLHPIISAMRWSRRHKPIVATMLLSLAFILTMVLGSLWNAANERQLRFTADEAKREANDSEKKAEAETERANKALATTKKHFDVALSHVEKLAYLVYGPKIYSETVTPEHYRNTIATTSRDIYATYLESLPPPEAWTFTEADNVRRYLQIMFHLNIEGPYEPWLGRLVSVVDRIEQEYPNEPKFQFSTFWQVIWPRKRRLS